jgi:hypothetical protein
MFDSTRIADDFSLAANRYGARAKLQAKIGDMLIQNAFTVDAWSAVNNTTIAVSGTGTNTVLSNPDFINVNQVANAKIAPYQVKIANNIRNIDRTISLNNKNYQRARKPVV